MPSLLLGVDGGATKTVALVADGRGEVLGAGRSGSSDIHGPAGPLAATGCVRQAVQEAMATAEVGIAALDACVFSLCGADWPEDVAYYRAALWEGLGLRTPPTVVNDAFGALRAGTSDGIGIALVLGTGAAIAARGPAGDTWFSGERMEASGAVELGRRAYELLIRGAYGPGPVPAFQEAALAAFEADSVEQLVHALSRVGGPGRGALGRLAPVLLEAGHAGDPAAREVIVEHGAMLASYVRAAARRVNLDPATSLVIMSGGLFRHHCRDLVNGIEAELSGFRLEHARIEPVYGALLMAADEVGERPTAEAFSRSGPDAEFFRTL